MTVKITQADTAASQPRSAATAMLHGARGKCPSCTTSPLFRRYLKVTDVCGGCGAEWHHHRADDAPPYFTILIVGHIIIGAVLMLEQAYAPPAWLHAVIWVPLTLILSLLVLPMVKGALVGLQWALGMHGFGDGPDPALPDPIPAPSDPVDLAR